MIEKLKKEKQFRQQKQDWYGYLLLLPAAVLMTALVFYSQSYFQTLFFPSCGQFFNFGSRASLRPSPSRFRARTVTAMARPGKITRCGA